MQMEQFLGKILMQNFKGFDTSKWTSGDWEHVVWIIEQARYDSTIVSTEMGKSSTWDHLIVTHEDNQIDPKLQSHVSCCVWISLMFSRSIYV